jgi:hypothetical protein
LTNRAGTLVLPVVVEAVLPAILSANRHTTSSVEVKSRRSLVFRSGDSPPGAGVLDDDPLHVVGGTEVHFREAKASLWAQPRVGGALARPSTA